MSRDELIVLAGGGVESTTLLRDALLAGAAVVPVFIECGLPWERAGLDAVVRVCRYLASPRLRDVVTISVDLRNLLPRHLVVDAATTEPVNTPEELEVPLRNLMLTSIAANAFRHAGALRLWVGTTADNSFNDGSRAFFDACETLLSIDLANRWRSRLRTSNGRSGR
jgi:7-cyano-7-deazaguanine synthase in queuosine biosynthesis